MRGVKSTTTFGVELSNVMVGVNSVMGNSPAVVGPITSTSGRTVEILQSRERLLEFFPFGFSTAQSQPG